MFQKFSFNVNLHLLYEENALINCEICISHYKFHVETQLLYFMMNKSNYLAMCAELFRIIWNNLTIIINNAIIIIIK
jgi:hypothetical protein